MEKIAIYPGSFDPITNGHMDIIERGSKLFDKVIVAILHNPAKKYLFTVEERLGMLQTSLNLPNVIVDSFNGLLVDYAVTKKASIVLRGMRAISDFEFEFQLALMNRKLNKDVQTVFLMSGLRWLYISSSAVKEAARFGGDITSMVPPLVNKKLKEKFGNAS